MQLGDRKNVDKILPEGEGAPPGQCFLQLFLIWFTVHSNALKTDAAHDRRLSPLQAFSFTDLQRDTLKSKTVWGFCTGRKYCGENMQKDSKQLRLKITFYTVIDTGHATD